MVKPEADRMAVLLVALSVLGANADQGGDGCYRQANLVSDQPGVVMLQDAGLVNAWGISFGPTTPSWVSNGTSAGDRDALFFTSGPDDESHGLFGNLEPAKHHNKRNRDREDED